MSHARIDRRSLAMHRAIARKLTGNPALLAIAEDNLRRWRPDGYSGAWQRLLTLPLAELTGRIVEESAEMTALRQSSPFAGVLSPRERWAIYREFARETGGGAAA